MSSQAQFETVAPRMPSAPRRLPAGACDSHAHVFGPYDRFPFREPPRYAAPLAPLRAYLETLAGIGAQRGVLVQPTAYGTDLSALLDALHREPARLRGIAVANAGISDQQLSQLNAAGVRGLRFIEMPEPAGVGRYKGGIGVDQFIKLAPRMKTLGWHVQLWAKCEDLARIVPELLALGVELAIDHMGAPDVSRGVGDPAFQTLLALLREGRIWMKLSVCRNSTALPDYEDLRPFHDALIEANPDRLLWGSDWPYVRMGELTPDPAHLVDLFKTWVPEDLRKKILIENPAALFGFEKA